MATVKRTSLAELDLAEIWVYIARDDPPAADRLIRRFDEVFQLLLKNPELGESVSHFGPNLLRFVVGNYALYYEPIETGILIYRVLHAARDHEQEV